MNNTVHTDKVRDMLRDRTYALVLRVFPDKLRGPWDWTEHSLYVCKDTKRPDIEIYESNLRQFIY